MDEEQETHPSRQKEKGKRSRKAAYLDGYVHGSFTKHAAHARNFYLPPV